MGQGIFNGYLCIVRNLCLGAPRLGLAANRVLARLATSFVNPTTFISISPSWDPDPNIVYQLAVAHSLSTCLPSAATPTPASYAVSTAMESFPEHNPKHASHTKPTKPTIEEIKEWDEDELFEWIEQKEPKLLRGDKLQKFKDLSIDGVIFLKCAGDKKFFHEECNLPIGTSMRLADLASEIAGGETAGVVQKGKEQDTSTGKSTDHTPLLLSLH